MKMNPSDIDAATIAWAEIEKATDAAQEMRRSREVAEHSREIVMAVVRKQLALFTRLTPIAILIARSESPSVFLPQCDQDKAMQRLEKSEAAVAECLAGGNEYCLSAGFTLVHVFRLIAMTPEDRAREMACWQEGEELP